MNATEAHPQPTPTRTHDRAQLFIAGVPIWLTEQGARDAAAMLRATSRFPALVKTTASHYPRPLGTLTTERTPERVAVWWHNDHTCDAATQFLTHPQAAQLATALEATADEMEAHRRTWTAAQVIGGTRFGTDTNPEPGAYMLTHRTAEDGRVRWAFTFMSSGHSYEVPGEAHQIAAELNRMKAVRVAQ